MHINVLEMRAASLALAAFLLQLSGQSVILMSDNASVVAYLRHQGGTVLHGLRDSSLDRVAFGRSVGQVHSVEEEYSGGPAQSFRPGSSHGMVPSKGLRGDFRGVWELWASPSQSLCHPGQCQASAVLVPSSGSDGLEARLIPTSLVPSVR